MRGDPASSMNQGEKVKDDLVLEVDLPGGDGVLVGMVFVGFCEGVDEGFRWFRNEGSVLGVVGVDL